MRVYNITSEALERDYHGCGKAWAAIRDEKVVALRYMGEDHTGSWPARTSLPAWVIAVNRAAEGSDTHGLPTAWSSKCLSRLAQAAEAAGDCPHKPRGGQYRPKELLTMARAVLAATNGAEFGRYREKCRDDLGQIGELVSGMCSCTQFYI